MRARRAQPLGLGQDSRGPPGAPRGAGLKRPATGQSPRLAPGEAPASLGAQPWTPPASRSRSRRPGAPASLRTGHLLRLGSWGRLQSTLLLVSELFFFYTQN